jgi:hypothetical protein
MVECVAVNPLMRAPDPSCVDVATGHGEDRSEQRSAKGSIGALGALEYRRSFDECVELVRRVLRQCRLRDLGCHLFYVDADSDARRDGDGRHGRADRGRPDGQDQERQVQKEPPDPLPFDEVETSSPT